MSDFTVDSMIVVLPSDERLTLLPIIDIPGWKWQMIIRFGNVNVPDSVFKLEVIVPFHYVDSVGSELKHDSVMFTMYRYESHQKQLWAEDIPKFGEDVFKRESPEVREKVIKPQVERDFQKRRREARKKLIQ